MNLKAPLKPGRSEVGLTVVIVVVVVGLACRLRDLWHLQRQQLAGHRRDFSLLENPESAPTLSIRFLISNFQWPTGEMWVTRQMAAHTGQHHRRSTMLLSITSSATLIDYWLPRMLLVEMNDPRLFSVDDVCGREDKKSRARLRPNVGRSQVRLCRWTSSSRAFRPSRRGLFLLLTKENVVIGRSYGRVCLLP